MNADKMTCAKPNWGKLQSRLQALLMFRRPHRPFILLPTQSKVDDYNASLYIVASATPGILIHFDIPFAPAIRTTPNTFVGLSKRGFPKREFDPLALCPSARRYPITTTPDLNETRNDNSSSQFTSTHSSPISFLDTQASYLNFATPAHSLYISARSEKGTRATIHHCISSC